MKVRVIKIKTSSGFERIRVKHVYGHLAVHTTHGFNGWTVTHIPTGAAFLQCLKYRSAIRLAKEIMATGVPLEGLTWRSRLQKKYRPVRELIKDAVIGACIPTMQSEESSK